MKVGTVFYYSISKNVKLRTVGTLAPVALDPNTYWLHDCDQVSSHSLHGDICITNMVIIW